MTKETIRRVDAFLGSLLCALLTLHRWLFEAPVHGNAASAPQAGRSGGPALGDAPRRILLIKFLEQGATVLAYEAIRSAASRVGRENVYFCLFAENRPILDILDLVPRQNVFVLRSGRFSVFVVDALRALRAIRAANIDATIDMEFFARASAIFAYLTGARRRVGLHRFTEEAPYRGNLMTHRVAYNPFLHTARSYRLLVEALDADPTDEPLLKVAGGEEEGVPDFHATRDERAAVKALLDEAAGRAVDGACVILNPNASDLLPLRKWPTDRFIELGRRVLAVHPETTLIITGAPSEREAAEELCNAIGSPRAVSLAGRTTLREVLVLYGLCDVLVTNDSGPGHFASLTDIDSIVLFGPGAPRQYGPIGKRSLSVYAELACSPCANVYNHRFSACANNLCMQAISVDEVLALVQLRLEMRASAGAPTAERRAS